MNFEPLKQVTFSYDDNNIISVFIPKNLIPVLLETKEPIIFLYYKIFIIKITKKRFKKLVKQFECDPNGLYSLDYILFYYDLSNSKITYIDLKTSEIKELK